MGRGGTADGALERAFARSCLAPMAAEGAGAASGASTKGAPLLGGTSTCWSRLVALDSRKAVGASGDGGREKQSAIAPQKRLPKQHQEGRGAAADMATRGLRRIPHMRTCGDTTNGPTNIGANAHCRTAVCGRP